MVGQRDPKFYSELKQTNDDLIDYLKRTHEKSPYFDFTPSLNDYISQINNLLKQYPEKQAAPTFNTTSLTNTNTFTSSSLASSNATTLAAAPPSTTTISPPIPSFSTTFSSPFSSTFSTPFGSNLASSTAATSTTSVTSSLTSSLTNPLANTTAPPTTTQQPFLFGAPISSSTSNSATSPFFSFVPPTFPPKKDDPLDSGADASGQDDEVHQPPEPKIDKYEEPDAKYSVKCKLYEREKGRDNDLCLTGIGTLYVKALDAPTKQQVIMRQDPDLRRVLLNEVVTNNIPVKLLPKAVQIVFPGLAGESKFYIVKLKDEAEANKLYDILKMIKL